MSPLKTAEKKIAKEYHQIKSLAINAEFLKETELPFDVAGGIKFENQAQFDPVKYVYGLAKSIIKNAIWRPSGI